jgi:hypothetical protein
MQAWVMSYVTDTFGDVPYSEALKGDLGSTAVRTPRYDAQRDIYLGLIESLTAASTALSGNPAPTLGVGDVIFGGDPAAWQRLANSLRARLALRMMNADAPAASAALRAALEAPGGLFRSNADNAVLRYPGDETGANPWASALQYDFWRMSRTLMGPMVATNDPRLPAFAMPTQADPTAYAGMPNGLSNAAASAWLLKSSRPGEVFLPTNTPYGDFSEATGRARPAVLMTFAEVEFIRAEAAARGIAGLAPAQAEAFYTAGITASIRQWMGASAADIAAFLAQSEIAYKSGTDGLNQIARQRWIAVFPDGGQAWAEWRRTCQPSTVFAGPNASLTYVPRRFRYSSLEAAANGANLRAAIARQGADEPSTRVWWDSKPEAAPTCR